MTLADRLTELHRNHTHGAHCGCTRLLEALQADIAELIATNTALVDENRTLTDALLASHTPAAITLTAS